MAVPEEVPFPDEPGLLQASKALFVDHDVPAAVARVEHEAAFVLFELADRRRVGLDRLRDLGHDQLLDAYLQRADYAATVGSMLVVADPSDTLGASLAQLGDITAQIREVPGFESFLTYPSLQSLIALGYPTWAAWVVSIEQLGYALLLSPGPEPTVITIPLPELTSARAYAQALRAWFAYRNAEAADATRTIDAVASWCWQACMGPIAQQLPPQVPFTLIPVGLTQLLPLHVAYTATGSARRYISDDHPVSVVPNLRLAAANRAANPATDGPIAAFAPQASHATANLPQLRWSRAETAALISGSPDRLFLDEQATASAFTDSIGRYSRVHFAGHANASISVPWASHLEFADGPATIRDLAAAKHAGTSDLGVLSCCTGDLGSAVRPTLGITIAGVLFSSCFRHVIASLWRVRDDYGALLATRMHLELSSLPPALALAAAQRWLREAPISDVREFANARRIDARWVDDTRADIASWGAFVHCGPSG